MVCRVRGVGRGMRVITQQNVRKTFCDNVSKTKGG